MPTLNLTQDPNASGGLTGNDNLGEITIQTDNGWNDNRVLAEIVFDTPKTGFLICDAINLSEEAIDAKLILQANDDGSGFTIQSASRLLTGEKTYLLQYRIDEIPV